MTSNEHHYLACNCAGHLNCERQTQTFHEEIRKAVENAKTLLLKEIQRATAEVTVNSSAANDLSENQKYSSHDESSECRELLRVQYNLNNLYKQELEFMCKTCTDQTQSLLSEIEALKVKIQIYEDQIRQIEQNANSVAGMVRLGTMLNVPNVDFISISRICTGQINRCKLVVIKGPLNCTWTH